MPKNIVNLTIPTPGSFGLNTQEENTQLSNAWATKATNCVFDDTGRLACRKGWQHINATALTGTPNVEQLHEYIDGAGNSIVILAANNVIYKVSGTSMVDISGTITTPTANNWKFVNFNGKCIGFQDSHAPIVITSVSGSFADITLSGTQQPTIAANEVLAAFGRLWCLDGTDLKYSDSLDETSWNGVFDLSTVWLSGMDEGSALAEFNGNLVVFGKRSIVVYSNPWVPTGGGGIDSSTMTLVENIAGVGCVARDSLQPVAGDLIFLSANGLRSLGRTIQEKSMPLTDISVNVSDALVIDVAGHAASAIKSTYSQQEGFYILLLPNVSKAYYFDLRSVSSAGSYRATLWEVTLHSAVSLQDGSVYFGLPGGYIAEYTGYLDNVLYDGLGGDAYDISYHSTWTDLGGEASYMIKIAKKFRCLVYGGAGQTANIKWAFDYDELFESVSKAIEGTTTPAEYNIAEYNIAEWAGGQTFYKLQTPLSRSGRVIKIGIDISVYGAPVALQQIIMQAKIGKVA